MTRARKPNPMPDSRAVRARASVVRGVTSPSPSVKNVVPLIYKSTPNPETPSEPARCDPRPQCSSAKEMTIPDAQRPMSRISESGPKTISTFSPRQPEGKCADGLRPALADPAHRPLGIRVGHFFRAAALWSGIAPGWFGRRLGVRRRLVYERHDVLHARTGRRDPADDARARPDRPRVGHGIRLPSPCHRLCASDLAGVLPSRSQHLDARCARR